MSAEDRYLLSLLVAGLTDDAAGVAARDQPSDGRPPGPAIDGTDQLASPASS